MTRASLASEVRFTRECFWKVRECERSHTRVFRECERYNSRVHREYEVRMTRAESTGLGEESAGPARRTRARGSEKIARGRLGEKARRLGEESTDP